MKKPTILRKRFIPDETVDISKDELLFRSEKLLVTSWKAIKPRADLSGGISFAFLEEGIKISRFYDNDGKFIYWYCDIIDVEYDSELDRYCLVDLLVDVKIMPTGQVIVLDIEELADALEEGIISQEQLCRALRKINKLLEMINSGNFPPEECRQYIND